MKNEIAKLSKQIDYIDNSTAYTHFLYNLQEYLRTNYSIETTPLVLLQYKKQVKYMSMSFDFQNDNLISSSTPIELYINAVEEGVLKALEYIVNKEKI